MSQFTIAIKVVDGRLRTWMLLSVTIATSMFCSSNLAQSIAMAPNQRADESPQSISIPKEQWESAGIRIESVRHQPFSKTLQLTGKIALNQDRIAHIYSIVDGTVESVSVSLGQKVKQDDLLAVIHSREIGEAKLQLYQARLQQELAITLNTLQNTIAVNANELLSALRESTDIQEIERLFRDRPMGDYRERALASYSAFLKSDADVTRLKSVSQTGAVPGSQLLAATANRNADQATFQSRIEQIQYELKTSTLTTSQAVKEAEAKVLVAETNLRILSVSDEEIDQIDPAKQGESLSHYLIRAPFDGTILTKDVVLREQVRPDVMLLSIADLSTVWVTANIYEENLPMLDSFKDQTITLHSDWLPDHAFTAKVFYTGEVMDEVSRTISLRAIADNSEHRLKPGMFVNIQLPIVQQGEPIVIPASAVQEHEGKRFVFVLQNDGSFVRRDVTVGPSSQSGVVIDKGLLEGESIVTGGGFILKSKLLAELLGEE
ncbi:MAG: efflux RND transporter periplasmic adaptor subunit [Aureliella sp.]